MEAQKFLRVADMNLAWKWISLGQRSPQAAASLQWPCHGTRWLQKCHHTVHIPRTPRLHRGRRCAPGGAYRIVAYLFSTSGARGAVVAVGETRVEFMYGGAVVSFPRKSLKLARF